MGTRQYKMDLAKTTDTQRRLKKETYRKLFVKGIKIVGGEIDKSHSLNYSGCSWCTGSVPSIEEGIMVSNPHRWHAYIREFTNCILFRVDLLVHIPILLISQNRIIQTNSHNFLFLLFLRMSFILIWSFSQCKNCLFFIQ